MQTAVGENAGPLSASDAAATKPPAIAGKAPREVIYRHSLVTRLTHWLNVLLISLLLMSGLQIFNAHPRLYWGMYGADSNPAVFQIESLRHSDGRITGRTDIGGLDLDTTGVLGASPGQDGSMIPRGFPSWATIPSYQDLATGRRWHFFLAWLFVANGLIYLTFSIVSGHVRRDLVLDADQARPRHVLQSIWDHMRLKHPTGAEARRYNVLQKIAYLAVIFVLLPLMVLTGLTMSPGMDAILPGLVPFFGGRQSARTIHFVTANLIVLFVVVHLVEVVLAGVFNEIGSMITGRYAVPQDHNP
jgi:thiosulfate reductase cytochrome b subunit